MMSPRALMKLYLIKWKDGTEAQEWVRDTQEAPAIERAYNRAKELSKCEIESVKLIHG